MSISVLAAAISDTAVLVGTSVAIVVLFVVGLLVIIAKFYRKVDQGRALIINKMRNEPEVTFTGGVVYPIIHRAEVMDISVKTIEIDRRGPEGLVCRDNIRADIKVTFFVRVNKSKEDVLKVAQSIGCARASDQRTVETLFVAKFSEALKTVGKRLDFEELYTKRERFRDDIIQIIGEDLNGYKLEDAAIDFLEQTPIEHLDKDNILDAQGIRKITEITTGQNVLTNQLKQNERKAVTKEDVGADEAIFELQRQRADAEARRDREIASVVAREQAQTAQIQAEERAKSERARIKAEEEIAVNEENRIRQVEVAQKNRERVVGIEAERSQKDRQMEAIAREHEVQLREITKEKAVEIEKKEIADVVAARIHVDHTVAEREEAIKDLRLIADAKRNREALIIGAEGEAQQHLVKELKAAEAREEAAKFAARERLLMAEADREVAEKQAQAKIRMADGIQAEHAAEGLADARVKEAEAVAIEKQGQADAKVTLLRMEAVAEGEQKQGLARVTVKNAEAESIERLGLAEAKVIREKHVAAAAGEEQIGLAKATVREANAAAIEKEARAEALAVKEKLLAEATGLAEKANAMKALDGVGREHEEFRLRLDKDREVALEGIHARKDIASAQAQVLSQAFATSKINIVGGDGAFFDRFVKAISLGQSADAFIDQSETTQTLLRPYLDGSQNLAEDLKSILTRPAFSTDSIQKLSLSALLSKLATSVQGDTRTKIEALIKQAQKLGIDDVDID